VSDDGDNPRSAARSHPNTRPCHDCGHIWFAGERRHEYLDEGDGDHADDRVLCVLCRRQRGMARREE